MPGSFDLVRIYWLGVLVLRRWEWC